MANVLFNKGREAFATALIDWSSNDIRVMLVLSSYVFDATDQFLADLGAVDNGRSAAFSSKSVTDGILDAADLTLIATAATASNALIIFKHTGSDATARVLIYIDAATGLPFTPTAGGTINITWNNGANKIAKL